MHTLGRNLIATFVTAAITAGMLVVGGTPARAEDVIHALGAEPPTEVFAPSDADGRSLTTLPSSVDLTAYTVPVADQGNVGSCVSWAIGYAMLGWYSRHDSRAGQPFAPMYVYSQTNHGVDAGSSPRDALNLLRVQGIDTQADYAPSETDWKTQPTNAERANAQRWRISDFHTLFSGANQGSAGISSLKTALAKGEPVAITVPVRPGFDNLGHSSTSVDNDTTGSIRGYHEILAVGYNSSGLLVQNSWGTGWGYYGFGRLSWSVVSTDVSRADVINGFGRPHDLTSDGANDLVARRYDGTLWQYAGNGTGRFQTPQQIGDQSTWDFFDTLAVSTDVNGDGFNDLLGRAAGSKELYMYPGNGHGSYGNAVWVGGADMFGSLDMLIASGDWNRDGRADLIGRTPNGYLWLYAGNGAGRFSSPVQIGNGWTMFDRIIATGDWNGDAINDLVARKPDGTLWLYPGNASGRFNASTQIGHGWQTFDMLIAPGDWNGDNHADILARRPDGSLMLYPGNGTGGFLSSVQVGSGWTTMTSIS